MRRDRLLGAHVMRVQAWTAICPSSSNAFAWVANSSLVTAFAAKAHSTASIASADSSSFCLNSPSSNQRLSKEGNDRFPVCSSDFIRIVVSLKRQLPMLQSSRRKCLREQAGHAGKPWPNWTPCLAEQVKTGRCHSCSAARPSPKCRSHIDAILLPGSFGSPQGFGNYDRPTRHDRVGERLSTRE